jgi:hypothetical protein
MEGLRALFAGRPWWANALLVFCAYMTFVYVPWDLFMKPVEEDQEVWFGIMFTGWAAKALTPLHWAVYGAGTVGFWNMRPWLHPWAALYVLQVAIAMLVWNVLERGDWLGGGVSFGVFAAGAFALYRARPVFSGRSSTPA